MGEDTEIDSSPAVVAYRLREVEKKVDAMIAGQADGERTRRQTNLAITLAIASPIVSGLLLLIFRGGGVA